MKGNIEVDGGVLLENENIIKYWKKHFDNITHYLEMNYYVNFLGGIGVALDFT